MTDEFYAVYTDADPDSTTLKPRPRRLTIVLTLEIVVRDDAGAYLLVTYPKYGGEYEERPAGPSLLTDAGEWTPPYIAWPVQSGSEPPGRLGAIRKRFDEAFDHEAAILALEQYCEVLGLRNVDAHEIMSIIEHKRSQGNPEEVQCYQIRRYEVDIRDSDLRNLADPQVRKGHMFLPIDPEVFKRVTHERFCDRHQRVERLYLSKPLASNLNAALGTDQYIERTRNRAVEIPRGCFFEDFDGFLFAGDLAGYGTMCSYVEEEMGGLGSAGEDEARVLRDAATIGFTHLFLKAGLHQVHTAGDGFICALPVDGAIDAPAAVRRFFGAYLEMLQELERLNDRVLSVVEQREVGNRGETPVRVPALGSRLAVHSGPYRYGKMSLAPSLLAGFDGAAIINVARLEGALREFTKGALLEGSGEASREAIGIGPHTLALSPRAAGALPPLSELVRPEPRHLVDRRVRLKEFEGDASFYEVRMP